MEPINGGLALSMSHYDRLRRDEESAEESLRGLIMAELDVRTLHALERLKDGRWAYLIETPFMTFPRFAVGTTSATNEDVRIVVTCGLLPTAEAEFKALKEATV